MIKHYHFRARIQIFLRENGGPKWGNFYFPESGLRSVPLGVDGVCGLNTVGIHYTPNAVIPEGGEFEANCETLAVTWEKHWRAVLRPGTAFHLWDGRNFASGVVLEVYDGNVEPATT